MLGKLFDSIKRRLDYDQFKKDLMRLTLFGAIVFLGFVLRIYDLGSESYWIDEMSTVIEGQQSIHQLLTSGRLDQPPAYYFPFHWWLQTFGTSEISTRSFSVLAGVGSIILLYWIGKELFGKEVGLLSALLMAVSDFQIFFSQEARFYSFFEFAALFSFVFFVLLLKEKKITYFVLYIFASVVMIYSHSYGIFIIAAQNLVIVLQGKKYKDVLIAWFAWQLVIFLMLVPYFFPLLFGNRGIEGAVSLNIGGNPTPSLLDPLRAIYRFFLPARRERSWTTIAINYGIAGAFLLIATWFYAMKRGKDFMVIAVRNVGLAIREIPYMQSKFFLLSCWLLCPIVLPFILSFQFSSAYAERYTISAAPALYLMLALGIFSVRKVVPIIIVLGMLAIIMIPGLYYYYATPVNEQWRDAAIYLDNNARRGDVVVFAPNMGIGIQQKTFAWYDQNSLQSCGLGTEIVGRDAISNALQQCVSTYDRFWLVIPNYQSESVDRYRSFFFDQELTRMDVIEKRQFFGISIYLFQVAK